MEILETNGTNKEHVCKIKRMINCEEPLSVIDCLNNENAQKEQLRLKRNQKKMMCITNFYLKKKQKTISKMEGARNVKSRLKKLMKVLSEEEVEILTNELSKIDSEIDDNKLIDNMMEDEIGNEQNRSGTKNIIPDEYEDCYNLPNERSLMEIDPSPDKEIISSNISGMDNQTSNTRLSISIIPKIDNSEITNGKSNEEITIVDNVVLDVSGSRNNSKKKKPKRRKETFLQKMRRETRGKK